MLKRTLAIIALALAIPLILAAQVTPLTIDIDEADAPYMFTDGTKPAGIYPAILIAAFNHIGVPISIRIVPWMRALEEADAGTVGVVGIYKTDDRVKKYDYSEAFFSEPLVVYSGKSKSLPQFNSVADFKGRKVGIHRGWAYGDDFDAAWKAGQFTTEEVNADVQNFQKLVMGRIDYLIAGAVAGANIAPHYKVTMSAKPLSEGLTYLIFPKAMGKASVIQQFNQAIKEMKKSGEFQKIVQATLK